MYYETMAVSDRVRGNLDGLLLGVLSHGPAHGYAVIEAMREASDGELDLPEGSVYPALHRLEESGLIDSSWAAGTTRRRRVYAITAAGRRELAAQRRSWVEFANAVSSVMGAKAATS